ncbi:MAG TPA: hypothetical protein VHZ78_08095 [Rhizomicrobium sp.]|jgi:hypothetical protein|nr:hypothetical protein [Rhizomicrobium sp.]
MKAMLLHISLPYGIEHLRDEIAALVAKLPAGSTACMHTETTVSIFIPPGTLPEILAAKTKIAMSAFSNWWLIPIGGRVVSKHSMDRLTDKMNEFLGSAGDERPRSKSQHVPLTQRREPRGKPTV